MVPFSPCRKILLLFYLKFRIFLRTFLWFFGEQHFGGFYRWVTWCLNFNLKCVAASDELNDERVGKTLIMHWKTYRNIYKKRFYFGVSPIRTFYLAALNTLKDYIAEASMCCGYLLKMFHFYFRDLECAPPHKYIPQEPGYKNKHFKNVFIRFLEADTASLLSQIDDVARGMNYFLMYLFYFWQISKFIWVTKSRNWWQIAVWGWFWMALFIFCRYRSWCWRRWFGERDRFCGRRYKHFYILCFYILRRHGQSLEWRYPKIGGR